MDKKWKSAKTTGNETETIIESWFQALNIPYKRENTMSNTRTRVKGSVDFTNDIMAIEVKKFTHLLSFKFNSEDHDLKWSQICILNKAMLKGKLAALIITEDNTNFLFIRIENFMDWWITTNRKSISFDIGKQIGVVVTCKEDLEKVMVSK